MFRARKALNQNSLSLLITKMEIQVETGLAVPPLQGEQVNVDGLSQIGSSDVVTNVAASESCKRWRGQGGEVCR